MKLIVRFLFLVLLFSSACRNYDDNPIMPEQPKGKGVVNNELNMLVKEELPGPTEMARLGRQQPTADFVPTGIALAPGATLDISVDLTTGSTLPRVLLGTYSRHKSLWNPQEQQLSLGNNKLVNNSSKERLVYIRYIGEDPDSEAKIAIKGGRKVPFYKLGETSHEDFVEMLDICECRDAQLYGQKAIVVASVANMKKYKNQDWNELLHILDRIIETEDYIDGLDASAQSHIPSRNRYLLTESDDTDFWMAATWYRTFYFQNEAIDFVLDINKLKNEGWGPWHELGHQHQLDNITWNQVVEVTVNIYSLAVERSFGHTSRLKRDNIWELADNYLRIPIADRDYNSDEVGPFLRLALYQQLWLHYGDEFYINLHKLVRVENKSLDSQEEKMAYFMLKASEVAGNNLKAFFKEWGFILDDQHFDALDALNLPNPSLDITTLRE